MNIELKHKVDSIIKDSIDSMVVEYKDIHALDDIVETIMKRFLDNDLIIVSRSFLEQDISKAITDLMLQ